MNSSEDYVRCYLVILVYKSRAHVFEPLQMIVNYVDNRILAFRAEDTARVTCQCDGA